ncbi:MAG: aspartate kinase, partial [Pyrinomonadaceae bacterium]
MQRKPTIMKFGGTSVADPAAFERVAGIVRSRAREQPVVVVSAMRGFTDALLRCFALAVDGHIDHALAELERQLLRHIQVAEALLDADRTTRFEPIIDKARAELRESFSEAEASESLVALKDRIASFGEQLSSELLALVLSAVDLPATHVDARRVVATDGEHGRANPLMTETVDRATVEVTPLVESGQIPVLAGFIGSTLDAAVTTLGRGGSDYSAAIVGAALDAREIQIWTDVSGVLTADPRVVPWARTVPLLSYQEAAELAYFGAKVLHPKTIQPAVDRGIPVRVCNSRAPHEAGTSIVAESEAAAQTVKAIAHKEGITTLQVTSARMLGAYGFLRGLFEVFDRHRTVVDVVTTSEVSVSLS